MLKPSRFTGPRCTHHGRLSQLRYNGISRDGAWRQVTQRITVTMGLRDASEAVSTLNDGKTFQEELSGETNTAVTNIMDIDRTPELLTWVFGELFGRKRGEKSASPAGVGSPEVATVGGGCFWCIEACFAELEGVISATSGYAGGHVPNPTYQQVCGKKTGHAEVVQVVYDASVLSYRDILQIFMSIHDPTTPNRQGNDVGPQYRSVILYHDEQQKAVADEVLAEANKGGWFAKRAVTEVAPLKTFYKAEAVHQRYYARNPNAGYCSFVVRPKLQEFRRKYAKRLRQNQVLTP
ncbi:hypothetical protein GPECTOR_30g250 [Gonium pectorale]|uniref:peptide-methionine (S)-S-oxide reductase n=1 Tax=Gonium pectorale TaxID=33097 RepID=A0A150GE94_GONPE|nr:hypothetical protein GPECTOR_30g250 [Gonium pectorale]|eukprot:KXZ48154.1 hypothetical protein GPECTOR_30g250 [Gonium pectorale]